MKPRLIALPGFLGSAADWHSVRSQSKADLHWVYPNLFEPDSAGFTPPPGEEPAWLAGYSFGARLALRWMNENPGRWLGALLVSANPGNFQRENERFVRHAADAAWGRAFRGQPWDSVIGRWNSQDVFGDSSTPLRGEIDYSRGRLAEALEKFSVADQSTDPLRLPSKLAWLAGEMDRKFVALQEPMREAGFPGMFLTVPGFGHRLLHDAPAAVAAALDDLVA
ncbi:MAG: alpha/beta fold hydrolase [Chthoniobacterales bacterium]|jgi:2-succinyl-6-hydroxy-2,4-cyclohexadiene-1-carboxylate synthase